MMFLLQGSLTEMAAGLGGHLVKRLGSLSFIFALFGSSDGQKWMTIIGFYYMMVMDMADMDMVDMGMVFSEG